MSGAPTVVLAKGSVSVGVIDVPVDSVILCAWLDEGSEALRYRAERILANRQARIDREAVRSTLFALLKNKYKPVQQPRDDDAEGLRRTNTRAWLLYVLPLVVGSDDECGRLLEQSLDQGVEPNKWCRYWALAGQHNAGLSDPLATTAKIVQHDKEDLVVMLAHAIRVRAGDAAALTELRAGVSESANEGRRWGTLRALRFVPNDDPEIVHELCHIVDQGANSDVTYDAIHAVGKIANDSEYARLAARTLGNFVDRWKTYRGRDAMRMKALAGLSRLRRSSEASIVIEQLLDDNPAVVCEAARALESILGASEAVDRVVEQTATTAEVDVERYAEALRWMTARQDVVEQLSSVMASGPSGHREVARRLLSEVGGAAAFEKLRVQSSLMSHHATFLKDSEERVQRLFEGSINDAKTGFQRTLLMDQTLFYGGVILVGVSAALGLYHHGALSADWVGSGATGVLGVLYTLFFAKPREQVQRGIDHLMNLKVVFLGFLRQLHQADSAYIRRLLDEKPILSSELKEYNGLIDDATMKAAQQLKSNP
jgi:hypothetical protein